MGRSDSSSNDSEEDRKARDEFAERLKKRDKERTRKVNAPPSDKKSFEEAAKRLKLQNENQERIIPRLRVESRRKYLEKRKEDKVTELEADIIDDEYLFDVTDLTEREKEDREHKKKLLSLAKEHEKARELERVQRYHMPQDIKDVSKEYEEIDEREKKPNYEQRKWEEEQMSSAVFHFGAKQKADQQKEYDLIMENQIDFIQALSLPLLSHCLCVK